MKYLSWFLVSGTILAQILGQNTEEHWRNINKETRKHQRPPILTDNIAEVLRNSRKGNSAVRERVAYGSSKPVGAIEAALPSNPFKEGPKVDAVTGNVFWVQTNEEGKNDIFQYNIENGKTLQWTTDEYDVHNYVNGYGGNSLLVYNNTVFFSNKNDLLVYVQNGPRESPIPITNEHHKSYADGSYSPEYNILFYVMENHELQEQFLVAINLTTGEETKLPISGDFFASPVSPPDSTRLAWIQYGNPNMPWDETKLPVTSLEEDRNFSYLKYMQHGSMMMPKWSQNNELFYVHDASNWWNLYVNTKRNYEVNLTPFSVNFGEPHLRLGKMSYDINPSIGSFEVIASSNKALYQVNTRTGHSRILDIPFDAVYEPKYSPDGKKVYMLAGNATSRIGLVKLDLNTLTTEVLKSNPSSLRVEDISHPELIQFPTTDGNISYGQFYLPKNNSKNRGAKCSLPPCIINLKGFPLQGPKTELNLEIQFFTSRGYAFLDIFPRGSSGFGKKYIQDLYGNFGKMDVEDVISGAKELLKRKLVDSERILARGEQLGGLTVLKAMSKTNIFKAGTIYRGVSNVTKLIENSHPFDKIYLTKLTTSRGKISNDLSTNNDNDEKNGEDDDKISPPIMWYKNIRTPTLFFHGVNDQFVHPNQTIEMHRKLLLEGHSLSKLILKPDDDHEFSVISKAEMLEAEVSFYEDTLDRYRL